jgi:hypothetical protein
LHLISKTIITLTLKKRGYKKGVTSVKFILPIIDNKWNFILKHYNETYSSQYKYLECSVLALKLKFCDLYYGPPIKSSSRTKYESHAKKIKKFIDSKAEIIFNNININKYLDNDKSIDKL